MIKPNLGKDWTTHMGVLIKTLLISQGDVVELGVGPASTPLLHWLCKEMGRRITSYENNPDFFWYAKQFQSWLHQVVLVKNWDEVNPQPHRGIVFVDHSPSKRRATDIIRFKNSADYIVIHDTNAEKDYLEIWPHFKYSYTWKACRPWVSVVSNFNDLSKLIDLFEEKESKLKNLLIYISPTGSFDNDRPDLTCNDAGALAKIQIDNSLDLGWPKKDILLFTNFNYQYRGVKASVLKEVEFFERKPQASKINAIVKLFENEIIKDDGLYFFHDLDAFQLEPMTVPELAMEGFDLGLTDYGRVSRWNTGTIFFKKTAQDIFKQIQALMYQKNTDEEKALSLLTETKKAIKKRVKKLNKTYNFTPYNLRSCYQMATKPLKIAHFHPLGGIRKLGIKKSLDFYAGQNKIQTPLITERLIKIFHRHGIK